MAAMVESAEDVGVRLSLKTEIPLLAVRTTKIALHQAGVDYIDKADAEMHRIISPRHDENMTQSGHGCIERTVTRMYNPADLIDGSGCLQPGMHPSWRPK